MLSDQEKTHLLRVSEKTIDIENASKKILETFVGLHGVNKEKSILNLKRELIIRTGYFLNVKKKYALRVINQEGVDIDEIRIVGLVPKRSDYPPVTRKKVEELIGLLLNPEISIDEIDEFDKKTECEMRELSSQGLREIGRPVSYSYAFNDYKRQPPHVLGMELWNQLEYKIFYAGSKGYMFRIKGVDVNNVNAPQILRKNQVSTKLLNNNYIVIPEDVEKVPEYYIIDVDSVVKFAWIDRVDELLKPFGGRYNNREKLNEENTMIDLFSDLFEN